MTIRDVSLFSEGTMNETTINEDANYQATTLARLKKTEGRLRLVAGAPTLSQLVRALNAIGASPKDLLAILQAMKKAGAIKAELEVI